MQHGGRGAAGVAAAVPAPSRVRGRGRLSGGCLCPPPCLEPVANVFEVGHGGGARDKAHAAQGLALQRRLAAQHLQAAHHGLQCAAALVAQHPGPGHSFHKLFRV